MKLLYEGGTEKTRNWAKVQWFSRPFELAKVVHDTEILATLDPYHEVVKDSRFGKTPISSIFSIGQMFRSKDECVSAKQPKGRFFCSYQLQPGKGRGRKFNLIPLREKSSERLVMKLVKENSKIDLTKSPHGKWKVTLNKIPEDFNNLTLNAIENIRLQTPKRSSAVDEETPKKKLTRLSSYGKRTFDDADSSSEDEKKKKGQSSMMKMETSAPSTPTAKKGIAVRRKSILKTPTIAKASTPRRSIQFSGVVEELHYEKKSARDKVITLDEADEHLSDIATARRRLHVSAIPKSLPCREKEFQEIYSFLEGNLVDEIGGCIYVSGVPGTGKTATTTAVIQALRAEVDNDNVPNFEFVEINGMRITEPRKAYVEIYRQLTGKTVTWEQAFNLLDKRFSTPSTRRICTILVVDELDILCNKRQDVVYNLLNWPNLTSARLTVVTIANTMDLPERVLMGKVASRLGLTRLTFQPYSFKQLQEIVASRLSGLDTFNSDAIQLVARKVAALSGDARRALDICRRASEIAEAQATDNKASVSMANVQDALSEMISCTKVRAIKSCSKVEKLFIQAVCMEVERTGVDEVTFRSVYEQLKAIATLNGVNIPTTETALSISTTLGESRLLICEHARKDIYQKILLNISIDDFYYATQLRNQD